MVTCMFIKNVELLLSGWKCNSLYMLDSCSNACNRTYVALVFKIDGFDTWHLRSGYMSLKEL